MNRAVLRHLQGDRFEQELTPSPVLHSYRSRSAEICLEVEDDVVGRGFDAVMLRLLAVSKACLPAQLAETCVYSTRVAELQVSLHVH